MRARRTCINVRDRRCRVVFGPERMITVPPRHYCVIENPVVVNKDNEVVLDRSGQVKLLHADQDIRLTQEPFPLYPGEVLKQPVSPLKVVVANSALRVRAVLDYETDDGEKRVAGDEWLFEGPGECSISRRACYQLRWSLQHMLVVLGEEGRVPIDR